MNYDNKYVMGVCLLPTYIFIAFLLAPYGLFFWGIGMIAMTVFTNMLYDFYIVQSSAGQKSQRYWSTVIGQLIVWVILFTFVR